MLARITWKHHYRDILERANLSMLPEYLDGISDSIVRLAWPDVLVIETLKMWNGCVNRYSRAPAVTRAAEIILPIIYTAVIQASRSRIKTDPFLQTVSNRTVRRLRNRMDLGRKKGPQAGSPIVGSAALRPWRTTRESAETGPQAISLSTRFIFVRVGPATIHNGKPSREDLFPAALLNLADNPRSESEKITR